jgi:hypothetical protein
MGFKLRRIAHQCQHESVGSRRSILKESMKIMPVQQQPIAAQESRISDQGKKITLLAIGILGSAALLAAAEPPGSFVGVAVILVIALAITLDAEDQKTEKAPYLIEPPIYRMPRIFYPHYTPVGTSARTPCFKDRDSARESQGEHIPVGTGERNSFPRFFEKAAPMPVPTPSDQATHIPVGTGVRNPFPGTLSGAQEREYIDRRDINIHKRREDGLFVK